MLIKNKRSWDMPEAQATPEHLFWSRREWLKSVGLVSTLAVGTASGAGGSFGGAAFASEGEDPSAHLYPVERNLAYELDRAITSERLVTSYNNFYEFNTFLDILNQKNIVARAQKLKIRPWTVAITGHVEKEMVLDIDDLLAKMPLEERLYRHRCVETWSFAAPWSGFPLKALVDFAKPLSKAKYVRMETFEDKSIAPGQKNTSFPWPYVEALTIEEATNELAFLATGVYGKPLPKQNGAPLRLAVPWKYGFKSIKSIVKIEFTDRRPVSFWEREAPNEYGFWANVNPEVPHARWSQAMEQPLGSSEKIPTLLYNGYAEQVAHLYKGLEKQNLFR